MKPKLKKGEKFKLIGRNKDYDCIFTLSKAEAIAFLESVKLNLLLETREEVK